MGMVKIDAELKKLIEENAMALATVGADGKPHCIAVAFVKVVSDSQILITDNYMVETRNNIKNSASVSLAVWNKNWKEECRGYALEGQAEHYTSGQWYDRIKALPENKGEPAKGAILITIEKIKKLA